MAGKFLLTAFPQEGSKELCVSHIICGVERSEIFIVPSESSH